MSPHLKTERRTSPANARRNDDRCAHSNPMIESRAAAIRRGWSESERRQRAQTARAVQWLLLGPPVGFKLVGE